MPYNPDCPVDCKAFVNGTRIPAGDVDIYIRKEGPFAINRYAEVDFAATLDGENYIDAFETQPPTGYSGDGDSTTNDSTDETLYNTLYLETRVDSPTYTGYTPTFVGTITGYGPSSDSGGRHWTLRAEGPEMLAEKLPAGKEFKNFGMDDVLKYIGFVMAEHSPFVIPTSSVVFEVENGRRFPIKPNNDPEDTKRLERDELSDQWYAPVLSPKSFYRQTDTLQSIVNWAEDKAQARIFFIPIGKRRTELVARHEPADLLTFRAHNVDTSDPEVVHVIENNALADIHPVNAIRVKGSAKATIAEVDDFEVNLPDDEYIGVEAVHKPLYKQAGGRKLYAEPDFVSDANTKTEVKNEAKSQLRRAIERTTGGDMVLELNGLVVPYANITAKPTCAGVGIGDDTLTFEITNVHHKIRTDTRSETHIEVGIPASFDNIGIVDSWQKDTTGDGSDDGGDGSVFGGPIVLP